MAIAHDAASRSGSTDATSFTTSASWNHPGGASPRAVVVTITQPLSGTLEAGTVNYGGLALTQTVVRQRTVTEQSVTYIYFLGSGVPAGTQTVALVGWGAATKQAHCFTMTAAVPDVVVDANNSADLGIIANPSLTVTHSASLTGWAGYACHCYGGAAPVSTGLQAGETYRFGHDPGAAVGMVYTRHGGAAAASSTYGYTTLVSDDQNISAIVVREQPGMLRGAGTSLSAATGTLFLVRPLTGASSSASAATGILSTAAPLAWADSAARWGDWSVTWTGVARPPDRSVNVTDGEGTLFEQVSLSTGTGWTNLWPEVWWTTSPSTTSGSGIIGTPPLALAGLSASASAGTGFLATNLAGDSLTSTTGTGALGLAAPVGAPEAILAQSNLDGGLTDLWDDPQNPGPEWLTALDPMAGTDLRVSFPTPATAPGAAGGPKRMAVAVRRNVDPLAPNPTVILELWESGVFRATLATVTVSSSDSQMVEAVINPADLADPTGAGVELRTRGVPT